MIPGTTITMGDKECITPLGAPVRCDIDGDASHEEWVERMSEPARAADDFPAIAARLAELRCETGDATTLDSELTRRKPRFYGSFHIEGMAVEDTFEYSNLTPVEIIMAPMSAGGPVSFNVIWREYRE